MIYEVEACYDRSYGGWSDFYIIEAKSKKEAEKKTRDYLDDGGLIVIAERIDVSKPYLVKEG